MDFSGSAFTALAVNTKDTITQIDSGSILSNSRLTSNVSGSRTQEAADGRLPGAESRVLSPPVTSPFCREQSPDDFRQTDPPRNSRPEHHQSSKHSQNEKWFCGELGCNRSQPGRGFKRRDNLAQHLFGVHKRKLEGRIRAPSVVASSSLDPTALRSNAVPLPQPKKRRREEELDSHSINELTEQLAAERRNNQILMQELASTRHELRQLGRQREEMERQHQEELER
jgi:hypothetical protein